MNDRLNMAINPPPTSIEVGGLSYNIATDYRVWIDILEDMNKISTRFDDKEILLKNLIIIVGMSAKLFGEPMQFDSIEKVSDFLGAVSRFAQGYPQPPMNSDSRLGKSVQTYSFKYDMNSIIIAFQKYYGEDISYRCEYYHWWEFLEKFRNLCGDNLMILKLMELRGYDGKDEQLRKMAARMALPVEYSADEEQMLNDINDEFYGAV